MGKFKRPRRGIKLTDSTYMKIKTAIRCDDTIYKIGRSSELQRKFPITLIVSDGNIQDYRFRLTVEAAKKLGQKLIESADLAAVSQVMDT